MVSAGSTRAVHVHVHVHVYEHVLTEQAVCLYRTSGAGGVQEWSTCAVHGQCSRNQYMRAAHKQCMSRS